MEVLTTESISSNAASLAPCICEASSVHPGVKPSREKSHLRVAESALDEALARPHEAIPEAEERVSAELGPTSKDSLTVCRSMLETKT